MRASQCQADLFIHRDELLDGEELLDDHLRNLVTPYVTDASFAKLRNPGSVDESPVNIFEPPSWACGDSQEAYASWIQSLCHGLCLLNEGHPIWPKCARLCSLKSSFAELLFPHLLFEGFQQPRGSRESLKQSLSSLLGGVLSSPDTNPSALRLVVQAFEFMNAFRCSVVNNPGDSFSQDVLGWKQCYWFDVPYLEAAKAALRCGVPVSSLLWFEMHASCTRARTKGSGSITGSLISSGVMAQRSEFEQGLVQAYQEIDEPDGHVAFDKGLDLSSVASAYERDEEWGRALGLFDMTALDGSLSASGWYFQYTIDLFLCHVVRWLQYHRAFLS